MVIKGTYLGRTLNLPTTLIVSTSLNGAAPTEISVEVQSRTVEGIATFPDGTEHRVSLLINPDGGTTITDLGIAFKRVQITLPPTT